jgi:hypothetical protein
MIASKAGWTRKKPRVHYIGVMCKEANMKHFSFELSSIQRDKLLALTKGSYLQNAKLKELSNFVFVLRKHYLESIPGTFIREDLKTAIENIEVIIQSKRSEKAWYEKPIGIIGIGLFITILGTLFVV